MSAATSFSGGAHAVNLDVHIGTPAPVVVTPATVVVRQGWQGDRYWDGHRYWERREWEEHERYVERDPDREHRFYHCPPGHAKKGEC
ncbi:hypothetical protein AB3X91_19400 [Paraburkholderia sp. BR14263]|uniref:hypothetical protein n=1 Tax=unclassified Paraburkholderia TaxID=2615204 RepID=UPI0034CF9981